MEEEKHYPPGTEPEKPAEVPSEKEEAPEAEPEKAEPEPEKAEPEEKPEEKAEETDIKKPRSVYDDLKDKKQEVKTERELRIAAETKATELQTLLDAKKDADTPAEKKEAAKDIKEFADKHGYDPEQIEELTGILAAKLPKAETVLTPEEADAWRADRAKAARSEEDNAIRAAAPTVKQELNVQDDAELAKVMDEVVRLAHTTEFHDKEVDYIIWKKKDELSKLVSPKKPSFEQGGQRGEAEPEADLDYSSGKVTPEQASKDMFSKRGSSTEIRPSK